MNEKNDKTKLFKSLVKKTETSTYQIAKWIRRNWRRRNKKKHKKGNF